MKKNISALTAIAVILVSSLSHALPHNSRSDVKSTVKEFVPWNAFHLVNDLSLGAGTPTAAEISTLGIGGIVVDAAGEDVHTLWTVPDNACVDCKIKVSVLWSTTSTTTSQTATWKVLYNAAALGEGLAAASTALDTAITADAVDDTEYGINETAQGVIAAGTLDRGDLLHILCELDAVSGLDPAASTTLFHGMFIEYTREKL